MSSRSTLLLTTAALLLVLPRAQTQAQQPGADFPEGPGKAQVVATCNGCHDINRLRAGYTPEGWLTVARMMQNMDAPVSPQDWPTVLAYLMRSFPERPRPAAVLVEGPVKVEMRLWAVPTQGTRPHDPLAARDGALWWTGQLANKLGRLDPATGAIREYTLRSPHTGPHGLAEDREGNIWFTGNNAGLIGRLDPRTGVVTEYPLPDPAARDPHTLNFDQGGILWFTVQQANRLGRLDPATGEIRLLTPPTPRSRPYGLVVNAKGIPVFVEFGSNRIGTIDPQTMAIREYPLPNPAARPRRLALADENTVYYADFARGQVGRLDLGTGTVKEWPSPSGPKSEPYGMVFAQGALWYSESAAQPNTIVRFDPKAESFQSWAIPGGGDIVRNMDVTPDGNPVMANSLANGVGMIVVK